MSTRSISIVMVTAMFLLIAFSGVVLASTISTHTGITATQFTSESTLTVSGATPVSSEYSQTIVAEFLYPTFPPVDLAISDTAIEGENYAHSTEISSTPRGSVVSSTIGNADIVTGDMLYWNCALWGQGIGPQITTFPFQELETGTQTWDSSHPAGIAYPADSTEIRNIEWP